MSEKTHLSISSSVGGPTRSRTTLQSESWARSTAQVSRQLNSACVCRLTKDGDKPVSPACVSPSDRAIGDYDGVSLPPMS